MSPLMKISSIVMLMVIAVPAMGAEIQGEADLALALRAAGISLTQLDRAQMAFGASLEALKAQAAKAAYWEDACRSTPECGGTIPDKPY